MAIAAAANGVGQRGLETRWLRSDGDAVTVAWAATPISHPSAGDLVLITGTDISKRKLQEEEIRASRTRILEAGDAERRRLERNLHDGAQQRLVSLSLSLRERLGPGGVLQVGQGEWFAGESLPRWRLGCFFRADGEPVWRNPERLGSRQAQGTASPAEAERFAQALARGLGVDPARVVAAHEDPLHELWRARGSGPLPDAQDLRNDLRDPVRRRALAERLSSAHRTPTGYVLPISWDHARACWVSGAWRFRRGEKVLTGVDIRSAINATMIEESIPPLRNAPSGTSAISCRLTTRPSSSRACAITSGSLSSHFGSKSSCHQRETCGAPPRSTTSLCAAGS